MGRTTLLCFVLTTWESGFLPISPSPAVLPNISKTSAAKVASSTAYAGRKATGQDKRA
jgi:hypothetical protein